MARLLGAVRRLVFVSTIIWLSCLSDPLGELDAVAADQAATASGNDPSERSPEGKLRPVELERRVSAMYARVRPAIVRWIAPDQGGVRSGVIVSAEGHVLTDAVIAGTKLTFGLSDGRNVSGTSLGWSDERMIGLAKLDGPGPWPHVQLNRTGSIRAGQAVITLGYAREEPATLVSQPLLQVNFVTKAAPNVWFMTSDLLSYPRRDASLVFNLNGDLVAAGWKVWWGAGTTYTDAKLVQTFWQDLTSGKNLDQLRLDQPRRQEPRAADPNQPDPKKAIPPDIEEKSAAATVRVRRESGDRGLSGVIVSADGLIATCGHLFVMPGKRVIVCLPDGRDAAAEVLGVNLVCDVSLLRILDPGTWPHVELGSSLQTKPGEACLVVGYGPMQSQDRRPSTRKSSISASETGQWQYRLGTDPSVTVIGGDSGGGVFDANGDLLAIHSQLGSQNRNGKLMPHKHVRVEVLREHWDELNAPFDETSESPLVAVGKGLEQASVGIKQCVVQVLDAQKIVALGTIVNSDGRILTKASLLPEAPACRLADGRVFPAAIVKTIREHDLAMLKIGAEKLPVAEWSDDGHPQVGAIATAPGTGDELAVGFVSHPEISIPPERGDLWLDVQGSPRGLEIVEVYQASRTKLHNTALRQGDIIRAVDGQPTPDLETYRKLFYPKQGDPIAIAGDQVRLAIVRDGKAFESLQVLDPAEVPQPEGQSPRYSGFARAYNVTVDAKFPLGGPVADRKGRIMGIAISWRAQGWLLVVPAATAKSVAEILD